MTLADVLKATFSVAVYFVYWSRLRPEVRFKRRNKL